MVIAHRPPPPARRSSPPESTRHNQIHRASVHAGFAVDIRCADRRRRPSGVDTRSVGQQMRIQQAVQAGGITRLPTPPSGSGAVQE